MAWTAPWTKGKATAGSAAVGSSPAVAEPKDTFTTQDVPFLDRTGIEIQESVKGDKTAILLRFSGWGDQPTTQVEQIYHVLAECIEAKLGKQVWHDGWEVTERGLAFSYDANHVRSILKGDIDSAGPITLGKVVDAVTALKGELKDWAGLQQLVDAREAAMKAHQANEAAHQQRQLREKAQPMIDAVMGSIRAHHAKHRIPNVEALMASAEEAITRQVGKTRGR